MAPRKLSPEALAMTAYLSHIDHCESCRPRFEPAGVSLAKAVMFYTHCSFGERLAEAWEAEQETATRTTVFADDLPGPNDATLTTVRELGFDNTLRADGPPTEQVFFLGPCRLCKRERGAHATVEAVLDFIAYYKNQIGVAADYLKSGRNNKTHEWSVPIKTGEPSVEAQAIVQEILRSSGVFDYSRVGEFAKEIDSLVAKTTTPAVFYDFVARPEAPFIPARDRFVLFEVGEVGESVKYVGAVALSLDWTENDVMVDLQSRGYPTGGAVKFTGWPSATRFEISMGGEDHKFIFQKKA